MSISSSSAGIFLSEKDLESMEFNILVTPGFSDESQVLSSEDEHEPILEVHQSNDHQPSNEAESCLEIKTPPHLQEFNKVDDDGEDEDGDGFITPTSLHERIPLSLPCPPAPRKPKSLPLKKRKAHQTQITLADDSDEIRSFFSLDVFTDLGGGKTKKFRRESIVCNKNC